MTSNRLSRSPRARRSEPETVRTKGSHASAHRHSKGPSVMGNTAPLSAEKLLDVIKAGASDVLDILIARSTTFWKTQDSPKERGIRGAQTTLKETYVKVANTPAVRHCDRSAPGVSRSREFSDLRFWCCGLPERRQGVALSRQRTMTRRLWQLLQLSCERESASSA